VSPRRQPGHVNLLESEQPNDFATFIRQQPRIHTIFFNGHKSQSLFRRHVLPLVERMGRELRYTLLPSTSPAHAGRSFDEKLVAWRAVARALRKQEGATRRGGEGEI
jgi:G:T/U-mismatch repair DNA glycosylase